jgi:tetratricopeptide (TPR) repeat protein
LYGNLHPATTQSLRDASISLRRVKRFENAERLIREAIPLDSQLVGMEHPAMGENFYQYASVLNDTGRFDEATEMFERSLAVDRATLGADHPYIAITLGDLGTVRRRAGDDTGAVRYFRSAVDLARQTLPPDHPQIASLLQKLGETLATSDPAGAEDAFDEALAIARMRFDEDHVQVLSIRSALATFYTSTGRGEEAIAIHRDVLARRQRTQGDDSPITARSYYNLAAALRMEGSSASLGEARAVADTAVARYRAAFPAESREVAYALLERADVLSASSDPAAREAYREAATVFRAALGPDHPTTQAAERKLAALR